MEKAERIQILRDLIQIQSVNGNELAVAQYLQKLFAQYKVEAQVLPFGDQRANLLLEVGDGANDQVLGITGHMDTVTTGDLEKWEYDPFAATVVGDRLYGRGAADMKSGLAAQVIAIIELVTAGQKLPGKVRLIATAGEEYGTPGANRLEAAGIAQDLSALIVGEPTSGNVIYAHSGSLNYRVTSVGKSVHSSRPADGVNAIDSLIDFCVGERQLFDDTPVDPYLGTVKHSVTIFKAGDQVNTIPDQAEINGNIRPTKAFPNDQVIAKLQALVDQINQAGQAQLSLEIIHGFWPVASDPDGKLVQLVLKASQEAYSSLAEHEQPKLTIINGATDASVFVKHHQDLPVVLLGADNWNISHQVNEYTTISSFLATIEAYKTIIKDYFA
ncbi:ArgE/DapE family deacylase [uncultured Limosilactobacillus sp.]|uniref:ArgE/DapE family deacylase n=1 Tax=uncultured Limosilactobacillus sp. TaxID=2837629 RepID=UPI0025D1E837|nr:ArgE/DapE family deacylase [uncultured Limosilactobacillus sp.]